MSKCCCDQKIYYCPTCRILGNARGLDEKEPDRSLNHRCLGQGVVIFDTSKQPTDELPVWAHKKAKELGLI